MADNYTALKSSQKKRYISKETFNSLDLSTIPVGSEYEVVSPIEKGDLSADINNALNKADNALPKPTNDTTGSAGQVLKKTANGSEWGDAPSGGVKLYLHSLMSVDPVYIIATTSTPITTYDKFLENRNAIITIFTDNIGTSWFNCGVVGTIIAENKHTLYVYSPIGGNNNYHILISEDMPTMSDTVTEL